VGSVAIACGPVVSVEVVVRVDAFAYCAQLVFDTSPLAFLLRSCATGPVSAKRVIWHVGFERLLRRGCPRDFEVRSEVPLSDEPARMDYLLLRKRPVIDPAPGDGAETLRGLWPMLPRVSVVEYKSPSRPYRRGSLDRVWSYVHAYFADQCSLPRHVKPAPSVASQDLPGAPSKTATAEELEARTREELCAVLVVPSRTPSLDEDAASMRLRWETRSAGYHRLEGGLFTLFVVEIDVVAPAEGDDLLYSLGHGKLRTPEARWFWMELVGSKEMAMSMQEMEGYDELLRKLLETLPPEQRLAGLQPEQRLAGLQPEQRLAGLQPEQRLAGLQPEQRLAGLEPEQRLAGLDRDHQALALPAEVLHLLPESYFQSLSPEIQAELRRRLSAAGH